MDNHRYPIGPFTSQETYSSAEVAQLIEIISKSPDEYRRLTENLAEQDLAKTYRDGSWTVQQLVHHVSDIALVHFLRMKMALTEADYKTVTLINMNGWASTPDGVSAPIADSLTLLEGVTRRYVYLAKSLTEPMLNISYYHPVRQMHINQAQALAMSAWHVQHHLAHIRLALS